jgi:hypothetical protein
MLNFPNNPEVNDTYTFNSRTWLWDGSSWTSATSGGGGGSINVSDDADSNVDLFVTLTNESDGQLSTINVSSSQLYFNPFTGTLNSSAFNSLSDRNYKNNILTIVDSMDKVRSLRGVEFSWTDSQIPSSGLIAQEVEEVLPHLVTTNNNGVKSINYDGVIAYLVESIKELEARLKEVEKTSNSSGV